MSFLQNYYNLLIIINFYSTAMSCGIQNQTLDLQISCTDGENFMSACEFSCGGDKEVYPAGSSENFCMVQRDGSVAWQPEAPCCSGWLSFKP